MWFLLWFLRGISVAGSLINSSWGRISCVSRSLTMEADTSSYQIVRFGAFEVDVRAGELRKNGLKIKLQQQPFQVLSVLLQRPGEVVTREELQKGVWPADTFVDFDRGLNKAINRVREALGDNAESPRFVETLPRRGYRFIAHVDGLAAESLVPNRQRQPVIPRQTLPGGAGAVREPLTRRLRPLRLAGLLVMLLVCAGAAWLVWRQRWRQADQAARTSIESVAVLPLENLSGNKEEEYFADGMTDELITNLGKIRALRVISRTSVMQYRATKKPLPQIARELNVDAVVEGTVLRSGDRVRINAQLIVVSPEKHLWAEEYERDLRDVLALQGEVAGAIANRVQVELTPQERTRLSSARPVKPEAYEAYLKGRHYFEIGTADSLSLALPDFQQAVEKDPGYAPAYCGLADSYALLSFFGYMSLESAYPKWKASAMKALEIDDMLAEAHHELAELRTYHDFDWPGAKVEYERAIELNPGFADAHIGYSDYLVAMGQSDEAIKEAKRASELDPLSPPVHTLFGNALYFAGAYDQALERLRKALDLDPKFAEAHALSGEAYAQKGMFHAAEAEFQRGLAVSGENPRYLAFLAHGYAMTGKRAEAHRALSELKRRKSRPFAPSYEIALTHAALGETDQAFDWLQKSFEERPSGIMYVKVDRRLASLRSDPRFTDLVRRLRLPP